MVLEESDVPDRESYYARRPSGGTANTVPILVALMLGLFAGAAALYWLTRADRPRLFDQATDPDVKLREPDPKPGYDDDEKEAITVFKQAKESIVNVDQVLLRRRPDMKIETQQAATGSGFAWDNDGRIVTNFHVVRDAAAGRLAVRIVLADRTAWSARVVAVAPDYDLAVVQVEEAARSRLKKLKIGTSKDLDVGQRVYAIGNPFGYSLTLTKGIISALDREIESPTGAVIPGAIQTQAPINPGNSGGPLLDKAGRMIGVNTMIASPSGGNVGIGFAIPADTVNSVVTELIRSGKIAKPDLGVKLVDQWRLKRWGINRGVMIAEVVPGGPADLAGLQGLKQERGNLYAGDLIIAINGTEIRGLPDYLQAVSRLKPGEKVTIRYERGDEESDAEVTVRGI
jgi:S1-C subfamily serine protease